MRGKKTKKYRKEVIKVHTGINRKRSKIEELARQLELSKKALEELSKCSGGCEGPLGCMCKAPIAREALIEIWGSE